MIPNVFAFGPVRLSNNCSVTAIHCSLTEKEDVEVNIGHDARAKLGLISMTEVDELA